MTNRRPDMRFAYIDSQGNEVSIPSVDALALRIELGAIGPDTELYDGQAERWGPAHTHEIFHTLSRGLGGEGGFVAPPPPVAPAPEPPPAAAPEPPARAPEADSRPPAGPPPHLRDEFLPMEDLAPTVGAEPEGAAFDFSSPILPDVPAQAGAEEPDFSLAPETPSGGSSDFGLDLDLTPASPSTPDASLDFSMPGKPEESKSPEKKKEESPASFDFGSGLELAPEPFSAPEPGGVPSEPAMDFSPGGGMALEEPMSVFTPDAPPAWMQDEAPAAPEEESSPPPRRRPAGPADHEREELPAEPRERPQPRTRPSPPRRMRSRSRAPQVLGFVAVALVGVGGVFGWKVFQSRRAAQASAQAAPALPPVVIPAIPAELLPRMRDFGELALGDMLTELGAMQAELSIPVEPNRDWLAGAYLAGASNFPDVQAFWEGIDVFVQRVQDSDTRVFHERYQARLAEAGVPTDTAAILLERADSGFLATRDDRFEAYALMGDLVNAALDLHEFLLRNEAKIEYAPAAGGMSRDPVLEAVPATKDLGNEMWSRVDRITSALDALGTLDKVTTERLTAVLFDRIRRAGFQ